MKLSAVPVVVLLAVLSACGSGDADGQDAASEDASECQPRDDETVAEFMERCDPDYVPPGDWSLDPTSTDGIAYLSVLGAVHPDLGDERTIAWGGYLCEDFHDAVLDPADTPAVLDRVRERFAGGDRAPLDDDEAGIILEAVTTFVCPEYA